MPGESLRELLQRADSAVAPAEIDPTALAGAVRQRAVRRRRRRHVSIAILLAVGSIIPVLLVRDGRSPPPVAVGSRAVALDILDLPLLERQRDLHERTAAAMLRLERARKTAAGVVVDPFLSQLRQERNRAALILVEQGDRLRRQFGDRAAAEQTYRQAARLFPDSPAGAAAGQRLLDPNERKGNES